MAGKKVVPRAVVGTIQPFCPGIPDLTADEICKELCRDEVVKLSFNESPYGPSPKAVAAMCEGAARTHLYFDSDAKDLRGKIADHYALTPDHVFIGSGGDEAIALLVNAFVTPGDEVIVPWPTFGQYGKATTIMDGVTVRVPVRSSDLAADLDAMLAAISPRTKIIFLCNPNNPTGVLIRSRELRRFLSAVPEHILVGIDEAYAEFVSDPDFLSGVSLIDEFPNVATIRTFSKIYGLAGMRIGYTIAHPDIVSMAQRVRPLFNVNTLAQLGAMAALEDREFVSLSAQRNAKERRKFSTALEEIGWRVIPSETNFIFADTGTDAQSVAAVAKDAGYIIRPGTPWGFPTFVRISLGTPEQNQRLTALLKTAAIK